MKKKNITFISTILYIGLLFAFIGSCKKNDIPKEMITVSDIDGNVYRTVTLGTQVWMAENLNVTRYRDGEEIPLITENKTWSNQTTPSYCWYENDQNTYESNYGVLYNWYAINTDKLCPAGWHVPSDEEWKILEGTVDSRFGINDTVWDVLGYRGFDVGTRLKAAAGWSHDGNGTDDFNFSALPGGYRFDGVFLDAGRFGFWWSSTESASTRAWSVGLAFNNTTDFRCDPDKKDGLSVRCLKD